MNEAERPVLVEASTRRMAAGFDAMAHGNWREAADFFHAAAQERELLPWREDEESAWLLSAAWLNHGDVLLRTGDATVFQQALGSIDRTIRVMDCVDLSRHPVFPERLILAWLNRASACCQLGDIPGSLRCSATAEALLQQWGEAVTPVRCFLSAMLRVNRSKTLIQAGRPLDAWRESKSGISRLKPLAGMPETPAAAIHARSIQCRALAVLLDEPGGAEKVGDWIGEATDAAEEALALVRTTGFRDHWVADLVRYGAIIYRTCQPHFLGQFLIEWLAEDAPLSDDGGLKEEMRGQLWMALADVERNVLSAPQETAFVEKQTRVAAALQEGLRRLA